MVVGGKDVVERPRDLVIRAPAWPRGHEYFLSRALVGSTDLCQMMSSAIKASSLADVDPDERYVSSRATTRVIGLTHRFTLRSGRLRLCAS